jgi:hypothetical protein
MYKFCQAVIEVFGSVYSREPNMEATSAGVGDFVHNTFILVVLKMKYYVIHFKIYEYVSLKLFNRRRREISLKYGKKVICLSLHWKIILF